MFKDKEKSFWDSFDTSFMSEKSAHKSEEELVIYKHTPIYYSGGNTRYTF